MYQLKPLHKKDIPNVTHRGLLVQAKLKIGQPGDKYEQEADAVADRVMRMTEGETLRMNAVDEEESIQMQPIEEEEEMLMPKSNQESRFLADPANLHSQINNLNGSGSSMDKNTLTFMGNSFGTDFSRVNIHTDYSAVQLNKQLNAHAFTVGSDIYFNKGKYNPNNFSGKRLLAHELTHVVQQGAGIQPLIQKNGDGESAESSSGSSTPLADLLSGLVRDQLSNTSMQGHLSSLGTALQGLAVESTTGEGDQPQLSSERLAALGISRAFEITSAAILRDPAFARLRQRIVDIIGSSEEVALIAALAAGLAAVLADIPLRGSPSRELGAGFSVGGSFDFGTIQSLQFNNLQLYAQYARDQFQTRLSGTVSRDAETGDFSGSGSGQIRLGNDLSSLTGRVTIDHEGQVTMFGRLASGYSFGGSDRLVFTTDLTHTFASGETIIQPGMSGRFSLGSDQSLRVGTSLAISTDSGLTGVTGFLEYRSDRLQLRIEGSMTGLAEERGIVPGGDTRIQGTLTIPFF